MHVRRMMPSALVLALLVAGIVTPGRAAGPPAGTDTGAPSAARPHFVRLRPGKTPDTGNFQTAAVRYRMPSSAVEVVLCSVVHVGEQRYFDRLQKLLSRSDLVLYEAVQVGKDDHPVPATDRWLDPAQALGSLLGLVHQASSLDYTAGNFVWADVSLDELLSGGAGDLLDSLMGSAPTTAGKALAGSVASLLFSALDPRRARAELARVLAQAFDDLPTLLGSKLSSSLIDLRNRKVIGVMDERLAQLGQGSLTILFGAGHMPDLDRTLQGRGWRPVRTTWFTAWSY